MSWTLFKKRLKRRWLQWIDPEFDGDLDAAYNRIVVGDDEFFESRRFICNGKVYSHFVNEDDCDEIMIRELVYKDGVEC